MKQSFKIAITGNPNSGKTTIFNNLTGAHQHVGNYPGVTVEKKEGHRRYCDANFEFTDLPGIYSLTARSTEELIARDYILTEKPDIVIDVVDGSHIERNLYLTLQLKEIGAPLIIALNMSDVSEAKGHFVDTAKLSVLLGIPIVRTVGNKKAGMEELLKLCYDYCLGNIRREEKAVRYGDEIETEIDKIDRLLPDKNLLARRYPGRWCAVKLLEGDAVITSEIASVHPSWENLQAQIRESSNYLRSLFKEDPEIILIDKRYGFISGAHTESAKFVALEKHNYSDAMDVVLLHKFFGVPVFLAVMWFLFTATFKLGDPFVRLIERFFDIIKTFSLTHIHEPFLQSLIANGVISGVGAVVSFLPNIVILYLFIALLEDSGYMARGAFIMDNLMHRMGLHGKSFVPLLIGFGCSVPAIMSTRILESRKDRLITMLIIPFMSCSARLTVYTLIIGAFFSPRMGGHVLFSIYLLGILMAVIASKLFSKYLFKGEETQFVMELPPYMLPTARGVTIHMWRKAWLYLKKAGTVILAISLVVWFMSNYPKVDGDEKSRVEASFAGKLGKIVSPIMKPIGLGDWKISVSMLSGFAAKEVVVSSLATLYSLEDPDEHSPALRQAMKNDINFNPLMAYVLMVFVLLSCPCMATFAAIRQETRGLKWPIFMVIYTTGLAWLVCFLIFKTGTLLGIGTA